jgi:hypothetical protein
VNGQQLARTGLSDAQRFLASAMMAFGAGFSLLGIARLPNRRQHSISTRRSR